MRACSEVLLRGAILSFKFVVDMPSTFLFLSISVISCGSLSVWFRNVLTEFFKLLYASCGFVTRLPKLVGTKFTYSFPPITLALYELTLSPPLCGDLPSMIEYFQPCHGHVTIFSFNSP